MRPCTCPRPTWQIEQFLNNLKKLPQTPKTQQAKEYALQNMSIAIRDRDTRCPICLGNIGAGL